MNISKIQELCKLYGFVPSKQYGQNYLINDGIVEKIVKAANLQSTDTVIEIGPGFGVLTFALAQRAKKVIAFEIEKKLTEYWEENKLSNLEIIFGDALKNLRSYVIHHTSYKVVANIPYQITSQILRTILELPNKPSLIVVMVQKEVAQRICAKPPDMSLLALSVQYYGRPEIVDIVTRGNFWPAPKVDSAILRVRLNPPNPTPNPPLVGEGVAHSNSSPYEGEGQEGVFFKFAKAGFAQKRKQLWRNLAEGLKLDKDKVKAVLNEVVGNEKVRAEELGVEEWGKIISNFKFT